MISTKVRYTNQMRIDDKLPAKVVVMCWNNDDLATANTLDGPIQLKEDDMLVYDGNGNVTVQRG